MKISDLDQKAFEAWFGTCDPQVIRWSHAYAGWVAAIAHARAAGEAEPVAWQYRMRQKPTDEWCAWKETDESVRFRPNTDTWQSRPLGRRDGFEDAVQEIDVKTGGDGEYRWSDIPERSMPNPAAMIERIVARFKALASTSAPQLFDPATAPDMTDLMVDPDTIAAFMEANPLPEEPAPQPGGSWFTEDVRRASERQAKIAAEWLSARVDAPQPGGAVKVKALEWSPVEHERSNEDPTTEIVGYEANTGFWCHYSVDITGGGATLTTPEYLETEHASPTAAKAAAQTDYERRILSALEAPPQAQDFAKGASKWAALDECVASLKAQHAAHVSAIAELEHAVMTILVNVRRTPAATSDELEKWWYETQLPRITQIYTPAGEG